jgi:rhodanese-related sulfurtransferase
VKEALRLQKENFVILDVRPEAEFKEVSKVYAILHPIS